MTTEITDGASASESTAATRILALVPDPPSALASLKIAWAAAAVDPNARVTALHVQVEPSSLYVSDEEIALQQLRESREGTPRERRDRTFEIYSRWLASIGGGDGRVTWREEVGAEESVVDEEGAAAHLVTIARPVTIDGRDALHAALFRHRHLVLHTPLAAEADPTIGRVMAIAWKPGECARRAIFRAMRWLGRADDVHLIAVGRDDVDGALSILRDFDIEPHVHRISRGAGSVGDTIVAQAHALGADSLVLGAYRRGQFLSTILGGVTRDILKHGDLPAFMVH